MPRTTVDKKETVLRIRLSEEMYRYLIHKSQINGITVSEYVRRLIEREK